MIAASDFAESLLDAHGRPRITATWPKDPAYYDVIAAFWRGVEDIDRALYIECLSLDHHRNPRLIGINLREYIDQAHRLGIDVPDSPTLKRALPHDPRLVSINMSVCSARVTGRDGKPKTVRCWVFSARY